MIENLLKPEITPLGCLILSMGWGAIMFYCGYETGKTQPLIEAEEKRIEEDEKIDKEMA